MRLIELTTPENIAKSFDAFEELRPSFTKMEVFVEQVLHQQKEGYKITAIFEEEEVVACVGFRIMTTLAWGKILYIDDLITKAASGGKGYSKILLDYVLKIGIKNNCAQIHLDTGYARHVAHKVYLNYGFELNCHHLALKLKQE